MTVHSSRQMVFGFSHIEGFTLGAGEEVDEVDEVAGGAYGMGVDRIGEVGEGLVKDIDENI